MLENNVYTLGEVKMQITKELAYLLGIFKDGSVYKNEKEKIYRIRIYQKNRDWLEMIQKIFEQVFNTKLILREDKRNDVWYLEVNRKELFKALNKILSKPVPEIIKNSTIEMKLSFIQGVFDAEGSILRVEKYENTPNKLKEKLQDLRINFGQSDRELLEFIKTTLEEVGIRCGKICGPFFKNETSKPYFQVNSYGIANLEKFYSLIGTRHPIKLMRFNKIIDLKHNAYI